MKPVLAIVLLSLACASAPPPRNEPAPAPAARKAPPPNEIGVEGGVEGGVAGGVVGRCNGCDPNAPRFIAPNAGVAHRLADLNDPRYRPILRPEYNQPGSMYWGIYKVCVSTTGEVTSVTTIKSTHVPIIDADWHLTIKSWPHRPYERDGKAYPFCYPMRIEVRSAPAK